MRALIILAIMSTHAMGGWQSFFRNVCNKAKNEITYESAMAGNSVVHSLAAVAFGATSEIRIEDPSRLLHPALAGIGVLETQEIFQAVFYGKVGELPEGLNLKAFVEFFTRLDISALLRKEPIYLEAFSKWAPMVDGSETVSPIHTKGARAKRFFSLFEVLLFYTVSAQHFEIPEDREADFSPGKESAAAFVHFVLPKVIYLLLKWEADALVSQSPTIVFKKRGPEGDLPFFEVGADFKLEELEENQGANRILAAQLLFDALVNMVITIEKTVNPTLTPMALREARAKLDILKDEHLALLSERFPKAAEKTEIVMRGAKEKVAITTKEAKTTFRTFWGLMLLEVAMTGTIVSGVPNPVRIGAMFVGALGFLGAVLASGARSNSKTKVKQARGEWEEARKQAFDLLAAAKLESILVERGDCNWNTGIVMPESIRP